MKVLSKLRNRGTAFAHDLIMIPIAWLGAYWLRFNLESIPNLFLEQGLRILPVVMLIQGAVFWYYGLYRGVWRFASLPDVVRITKAVILGVAASAVVIFLMTRLVLVPRSVFPLYGIMLIALISGPRLAYRYLKDHKVYRDVGKKVLIVGAGRAGETLVRDLIRDRDHAYEPVVFVDDDRRKRGREIHGVRVVASCGSIPKVVEDARIDLIMIALPSATSAQMRNIVQLCEQTDIPFRTLPRLQDLVSGRASLNELKEVSIEDLLGREQVALDWDAISETINGKKILVSGGGGSIGSELCRQIAHLGPETLIILEHGEHNLYAIELELQERYPNLRLSPVLGDVGDPVLVDDVLARHKPQIVFHAAAYKHVPLLEDQVRMAAVNNVLGTRNLASLCDNHGCEAFVMVSTDKAVNPKNVMGTTKRVAEIYCQNLNKSSRTCFITVRFGNVLASTGSVIPLFKRQIARGGPVTVTHPDIIRYFMTISEATQLILQASTMGEGGEIFVLDMGEPVKIAYLAEQMILLSGKQPGEDIEIVYTGLRPGEKLYEELFHNEEAMSPTSHPKILKAASREATVADIDQILDGLRFACDRNETIEIESIIKQLVPEHMMEPAQGTKHLEEGGTVVEWKKNRP